MMTHLPLILKIDPLRSPLGPTLANFFLAHIETKLLILMCVHLNFTHNLLMIVLQFLIMTVLP